MNQHRVLNDRDHRELRVLTDASSDLGDAVMACLTVPYEFRQVQACYPIVFRRDLESDAFSALALFGFTNGENLFLENGKWDAPFKPLAQAIQPFLVGRPAGGEGESQVHVDMEHPRISTSGEGVRVFDEDGRATPYLESIAEKLGNLDVAYRASGDFYAALKRYELLEPFTLEVPLSDGSKHSLVGFHIINEEKLQALGPDELADLHSGNHLMPIFMALASLSHFGDLIARKNRRLTSG
ncbi:multidrug transporter [Altererythrobacter salegens]|uniref:Multidrug transporter n=1 Tax=Croceibacterium salegens TaxID=1737568 RepID=A0A6I4SUC1_9SPHN|nr:SapC family protein [Croceibacterium salegens]MXO59473.1 multidrug transporter [Croceibacterium salegens]